MLVDVRDTKNATCPELTPREKTTMHPFVGLLVGRPQLSQERAHAESVPAWPERSTHQFTNEEHQGVSSLEAEGASRLVER